VAGLAQLLPWVGQGRVPVRSGGHMGQGLLHVRKDLPDLRGERTLCRMEDRITRCWLPRFRARLAAGQSAEFGAVALSSEGVRYRRRVFLWQRVAEYKVRNPGPGRRSRDPGPRLYLYVREPGRSDNDVAWPEVVIPSLEIDYMMC
jgi:hypothetical protein